MAIAGLNMTILTYTRSKADMLSRLDAISSKIIAATKNETQLMEDTIEKRKYYADKVAANPNYADTTEYKNIVTAIEDDFKLQLKKITAWEAELNMEKNSLETEINAINGFLGSSTESMKKEIKNDYTFGSLTK